MTTLTQQAVNNVTTTGQNTVTNGRKWINGEVSAQEATNTTRQTWAELLLSKRMPRSAMKGTAPKSEGVRISWWDGKTDVVDTTKTEVTPVARRSLTRASAFYGLPSANERSI